MPSSYIDKNLVEVKQFYFWTFNSIAIRTSIKSVF